MFITTDKNLRYQQKLASRKMAIVVFPTTQWPALPARADEIARITANVATGAFIEIPAAASTT